jgi:hypothetical protein
MGYSQAHPRRRRIWRPRRQACTEVELASDLAISMPIEPALRRVADGSRKKYDLSGFLAN